MQYLQRFRASILCRGIEHVVLSTCNVLINIHLAFLKDDYPKMCSLMNLANAYANDEFSAIISNNIF